MDTAGPSTSGADTASPAPAVNGTDAATPGTEDTAKKVKKEKKVCGPEMAMIMTFQQLCRMCRGSHLQHKALLVQSIDCSGTLCASAVQHCSLVSYW